jgi:hypothetical protein
MKPIAFVLSTLLTALAIDASANDAPPLRFLTFVFAQKEITVTAGTKIVWTSRDETTHTIGPTDDGLAPKAMDINDRFECTSASNVLFNCISALHPIMIDPGFAEGAPPSPAAQQSGHSRYATPLTVEAISNSDDRETSRFARLPADVK